MSHDDKLLNKAHISAVVLAGGMGRRMGGVEKGLLPFRGRPLITHVLERIAPQVDEIAISTPNADYARLGYPLLPDALPGREGPLAGLLTAMERTGAEFVLSVPCDVPLLPVTLAERLEATLRSAQADACAVWDGSRLHPVTALWRPSVAPALRRYLQRGERRVRDFYESLHHAEADFSDQPASFVNVNTPDDLHRLQQ